jgi:hypothetical protein
MLLRERSPPQRLASRTFRRVSRLKSAKTPLAIHRRTRYVSNVNELIESGDPSAKIVGKRHPPPADGNGDWEHFNWLQRNFQHLWGGLPFPKGVHRFKSMEEFDEWKTKLMMRNAPGRR